MSTDDLTGAESAVRNFDVEFPILYTSKDPSVPESYGVFNLHGDGLASASIFLIDPAGRIRWQDIGDSYTHQVPGEAVVRQIQELDT